MEYIKLIMLNLKRKFTYHKRLEHGVWVGGEEDFVLIILSLYQSFFHNVPVSRTHIILVELSMDSSKLYN